MSLSHRRWSELKSCSINGNRTGGVAFLLNFNASHIGHVQGIVISPALELPDGCLSVKHQLFFAVKRFYDRSGAVILWKDDALRIWVPMKSHLISLVGMDEGNFCGSEINRTFTVYSLRSNAGNPTNQIKCELPLLRLPFHMGSPTTHRPCDPSIRIAIAKDSACHRVR